MRILSMLLLSLFPFQLNAQRMAIGGYVTPAYGNIAYKSDFYNPAFTIGGGLAFNYYKNRWLFNTGLNFKNARAFQKIPIFNAADTEASGYYAKLFYSMYVLTIPLGVDFAFVSNEKFRFYGGLTLEYGYILDQQVYLKSNDFKANMDLEKGYYLGIMPKISIECDLSPKVFIFSKIGLSYQLNTSKMKFYNMTGNLLEWNEKLRINNLSIDIGFGYQIKN